MTETPNTETEAHGGPSGLSAGLERLPRIPVGDRFKDETLFRVLGIGAGDTLYECWASAIRKYTSQCVMEEREACANVAEEFEDDMGHGKAQKIADAIRMRSNAGIHRAAEGRPVE